MFEESTVSSFESPLNLSEATHEVCLKASRVTVELSPEVRAKSAREIAAEYNVSDKTVQIWFKTVMAAYLWIEPETLKTGKSAKTRYTPLCQALISEYRAVAAELSEDDWIASVHAANPDKMPVANVTTAQPVETQAIRPEVLPQTGEATGQRLSGLSLHLGSSLTLPAIPGIVPPGNDTAYLSQTQQKLEQFEALQQQVLTQMQQQYDQAQTLNAQYQEATSLSDQLLLQKFQLRGVQLGYTALQLKQQAFKSTVQAAESGTLAVPGKPQPESAQPQPA